MVEREPGKHLDWIVSSRTGYGALICVHNRQLSICTECSQKAEKRFKPEIPDEERFEPAEVEPGVPEVERAASRDLAALQAYAKAHEFQETRQQADARLERHTREHPFTGEEYSYRAYSGVPYKLSEELLPAGESAPEAPRVPAKTFTESWESYKSALYAIKGTLSVAHSLIFNEVMRTPRGGPAWKNLSGLMERLGAISEALSSEITSVGGGEGEVE